MNDTINIFSELMASLPTALNQAFDERIQAAKKKHVDVIIVLDDDPTGTQTVYDVPVLTSWEKSTIEKELQYGTTLFFILTNSRSLPESEAIILGETIGQNIRLANVELNKKYLVVSRSDSTLRGHYPAEVTALEKGLQIENSIHLLIPAFFEGGRYTINDVHYVKENDRLIPAAQTPFAKDKAFGYSSSNLKEWVAEKMNNKIIASDVKSIGLETIREKKNETISQQIKTLKPNEVCIVNAADYNDLKKTALTILQSDQTFLLRTAASFVAALDGKPRKPLLDKQTLEINTQKAGLVVVGSYVPKTTRQLAHLQKHTDLVEIELDVENLLKDQALDSALITKQIDAALSKDQSVLLYTSRKLISESTAIKSLNIGQTISDFISKIVAAISISPEFIMAKGGITSSDIATKSLEIQRSMVLGQLLPGVPIWRTEETSKFPNLPYVIFPGNVGDDTALTTAFLKLTKEDPSSTNPVDIYKVR